MKKCLLALFPLLPLLAAAQPKVKELTYKSLPSEVSFNGELVQALTWQDNNGENIVVLSETEKAMSTTRPEKGYYEASLDARHFVKIEEHWHGKWTLHDQVNECNLLINSNFVDGAFEVTDKNNNGVGEVWMVYNMGCHRDKQPSYMKVVMYEGETRYSMRGLPKGGSSKDEIAASDYTLDANFKQGPAAFKDYALELWKDNATSGSSGKGKGYYRPRRFK